MASAAPKPAPDDTPKMPGLTRGLRNTPWNAAPDAASAAPTIAAARARGVRFGRPPKALPDNFDEVCRQWRAKKLSLAQAAESCGMPRSSFFYRARAAEAYKKAAAVQGRDNAKICRFLNSDGSPEII